MKYHSFRLLPALLMILCLGTFFTVANAQAQNLTPPQIEGADLSHYNLTFNDEFDVLSATPNGPVDGAKWSRLPIWWHKDYSRQPLSQHMIAQNGVVQIFPNPTTSYCKLGNSASASTLQGATLDKSLCGTNYILSTDGLYSWNCNSADKSCKGFAQKYGYFEARIKIAPGRGLMNTFWLKSPTLDSVHPKSEIDIFEISGGQPRHLYTTTQDGINRNGETNGGYAGKFPKNSLVPLSTDLSQGFHTYGMLWHPGGDVTWYLDGRIVNHTRNVESDGVSTLDSSPMIVMMTLDGYDWVEKAQYNGPTTGPGAPHMDVDYIRVWSSN
jgi:hypothetical protein